MQVHTHLRGKSPLPRLGAHIKGWGNPFVWEPSRLDRPFTPPIRRAGRGFEWPGHLTTSFIQQFPPTQLLEDSQWESDLRAA